MAAEARVHAVPRPPFFCKEAVVARVWAGGAPQASFDVKGELCRQTEQWAGTLLSCRDLFVDPTCQKLLCTGGFLWH